MSQPFREDSRPWEQPGAVRRDCEPHRRHLLRWLAGASMLCAWLTLLFWVPGFVGLALGVIVWVLADRDLAAMRSGLQDPDGRRDTQEARAYAIPAVAISAAALHAVLVGGRSLPVVPQGASSR